ncbi:MAG: hypothetical protein IIA03_09110, partial [Proteobacteria bacterium]|nr:hypothetical protein [Pseudomonadota bacterium]
MHQPLSLNELQALLTRVFSPDALGEWALLLGCLALAGLFSWVLSRAVTQRENSVFFGDRVIDTPLSENGFIGAAVGSAAVGMRPIVQSLSSFLWVAMDQLVSQA